MYLTAQFRNTNTVFCVFLDNSNDIYTKSGLYDVFGIVFFGYYELRKRRTNLNGPFVFLLTRLSCNRAQLVINYKYLSPGFPSQIYTAITEKVNVSNSSRSKKQ